MVWVTDDRCTVVLITRCSRTYLLCVVTRTLQANLTCCRSLTYVDSDKVGYSPDLYAGDLGPYKVYAGLAGCLITGCGPVLLLLNGMQVDAILLQILNGWIKAGLTMTILGGIWYTWVGPAHGALFMLGAFCAVTVNKAITVSAKVDKS